MITSLGNAKVKHARALLQQRKARERHQQFMVEGARLMQEVERAGIEPALIFCAPEFSQSEHGQRIARRWPKQTESVSDKVLVSLSDTLTPQGVVAVVPCPSLKPVKRDLLLIVDNLRDPGNLGTLLRSALAAGVDEALVSAGSADVYSPKVVRAAMGAHFHLPIQPDVDWPSLTARVGATSVLLAETNGELDYAQYDWRQPSALLVGGEAEGASAEGRALAKLRMRIPMHAKSESLNAAAAGSIILFEAARQRRV
jgi:RNA methyltransferase, TrmH family